MGFLLKSISLTQQTVGPKIVDVPQKTSALNEGVCWTIHMCTVLFNIFVYTCNRQSCLHINYYMRLNTVNKFTLPFSV